MRPVPARSTPAALRNHHGPGPGRPPARRPLHGGRGLFGFIAAPPEARQTLLLLGRDQQAQSRIRRRCSSVQTAGRTAALHGTRTRTSREEAGFPGVESEGQIL